MKYRNMFLKFYAPNDGEGSDLGGEKPTEEKTFTQAEVEALTQGLQKKNQELIGDKKALREKLAVYDGIDPERAKSLFKQVEDEEERKLLEGGNVDAAFEKRTTALRNDYQKQLQEVDARLTASEQRAAKLSQMAVNGALTSAATTVGALPESLEALQAMAKGVFVTNDDGAVVALDADGDVVYGKDPTQPLTVAEWLEEKKGRMPHLFHQPKGIGALSARNTQAAAKNPFAKETFNLTEQGKMLRENPAQAQQLAAQAGIKLDIH
ncbi:hypothetical protein LVJ82_00610 [Vitreoscilla massiliensis]|uniref:Phage minor structural protein GP20 n=1 Tax=Vitreoscilla massiliensis TaxID=1689272 RepID=A0ABY4E142_9NEIS|nr:hypothetical protein [Vitreoscilla massiliensis]UOO89516.1 hypothetical protein LVJ82_00610 [Vitreoscilla massiliensis]